MRKLKTANALRPWEKKVANVRLEKWDKNLQNTRELGTGISTSSKSVLKNRKLGGLFSCEVRLSVRYWKTQDICIGKRKQWYELDGHKIKFVKMHVLPEEMWGESYFRLCYAFYIQERWHKDSTALRKIWMETEVTYKVKYLKSVFKIHFQEKTHF